MAKTLAVILSDPLSPLLEKGEVTARYYNPGEVFDDVHIVLCNDDLPNREKVQAMVGSAKLHLHNLPPPGRFFWRTCGWQEEFMSGWLEQAGALALTIRPDLIRCYGPYINATAARRMREKVGSKLVISLHHRPDIPPSGMSFADRLRWYALERLSKCELLQANLVLAVYKPQLSYLKKIGVEHYELAYNVLNPKGFETKNDYSVNSPVRVVSLGRLTMGKNPESLIKAVAGMKDVTLELIGDGPLRHSLQNVVRSLDAEQIISFIPAMDNGRLCAQLKEYDLFAVHCEFPGIPKAVLEAFLVGLPVIVNKLAQEPTPELHDGICMLVDNTVEGYTQGLSQMIGQDDLRRSLGQAAFAEAMEFWSPEKTEQHYTNIYYRLLEGK